MGAMVRRFAALVLVVAAFHASGLVWCASPSGHAALEFFLTGCCQSADHESADESHDDSAFTGKCGAWVEGCTDFRLKFTGSEGFDPLAHATVGEAPALAAIWSPSRCLKPSSAPFPDPALARIRSTVLLT